MKEQVLSESSPISSESISSNFIFWNIVLVLLLNWELQIQKAIVLAFTIGIVH